MSDLESHVSLPVSFQSVFCIFVFFAADPPPPTHGAGVSGLERHLSPSGHLLQPPLATSGLCVHAYSHNPAAAGRYPI